MEEYDGDPNLGLLVANEIDFVVADKPSWFSVNFEDSIVCKLLVFENPGVPCFHVSCGSCAFSRRVA